MPITKQYGKGSPVVRHNNDLDVSTKDNTAAGRALGATPELDSGWSYPPAGAGDWGVGGRFRAFFPTPQQPTFRDTDTMIKRPTDDFSEKMSFNIIYPWVSSSSGARSGRCETYTNHPTQKQEFTCVRTSVYRPVGEAVDSRLGHIFYQVHNGSGSPSFSLIEQRGGFIEFRIFGGGSGAQNTTGIFIGNLTRGVWHDITIFSRWIFGTDSSAQGYHLCFYGNKIARSFLRSGSVPTETIAPGQVPRQTTSSTSQWSLNESVLGTLPLQVTESSVVRDLLFFKGRTMADPNYSTLYPKWGIYKSSWGSSGSQHYSTDEEINAKLDLGEPWSRAVLANPDNLPTAQTTYAPPELATGTVHTSTALGNVGPGETHEFMFEQLNDGLKIDSVDRALIASEPELSWFTLNAVAESYTVSVTATSGGTVNTNGGSYTVGTILNLIATPSSGFTFSRWRNVLTGNTLSSNQNYSYEVLSDISIQAVFTSIIPPSSNKKFRGKKSNIV
jgi:hypothetical protein